ncbi:MAG: tetratricopeptide repeat protein [Planctomycetes bacterium]|nr:tetratricopeptide repeat protein [Planctomycetota bacterium]
MHVSAASVLVVLAVASAAGAQEVRPYAGKYAGDPETARLMARLPALMKESARAMGERLGLADADASNVVLELVDLPLGPRKDIQLGGTATRQVDGHSVQWITLNPESHFSGNGDLDVEVAHEMTHALLRNALGDAAHRALPKWAREGLAVWSAGQGPGRIAYWLGLFWEKPDPVAALLNGLDNATHAISDYPEDYLAIAFIESAHGIEGVHQFVKRLAAGKPATEAVAEVTGQPWAEFEKDARTFSEARLREALGDAESAAWRRSMATYRAGKDYEAAQRALFAVAARFPDSWAGALALYYFGRALQLGGNFADARDALVVFAGSTGSRTGLMDDAIWNIALCEEKLGRTGAAVETCDRLARDFSFSPQAPMALLKAAGICDASGRADEAKARYERIVKDLAGTKEAEEAKKKLER